MQIKTTANKGDVFMIGSFWGGGDQKNRDFRLEFYKKRRRFYEFLTLAGTNNDDDFILFKVNIKFSFIHNSLSSLSPIQKMIFNFKTLAMK